MMELKATLELEVMDQDLESAEAAATAATRVSRGEGRIARLKRNVADATTVVEASRRVASRRA